jgi:hypothetical protein
MIPDPIILSDDESVGSEPDSDFSSLDIDLAAKRDSYPLHVADNGLVDGSGSSSRTTVVSDRLVADHQDDGVVDSAESLLAAGRPRPASPGHTTVTLQASKLRVNAEITQGSVNHVDVDVTKEVGDEDANIFAKVDDDDGKDSRSHFGFYGFCHER